MGNFWALMTIYLADVMDERMIITKSDVRGATIGVQAFFSRLSRGVQIRNFCDCPFTHWIRTRVNCSNRICKIRHTSSHELYTGYNFSYMYIHILEVLSYNAANMDGKQEKAQRTWILI